MRTHDVKQAFANLLQEHLGPRWEVTRDVIGRHPEALDELLSAVSEDLRLLDEQLRNADGRQREVDLRITVEHVVVLLSRLLPVVGSVVADLYMTNVSELERAEPRQVGQEQLSRRAEEIRSLANKLEDVLNREARDQRSNALVLLDAAALLAALYAEANAILHDNLVARLNSTS